MPHDTFFGRTVRLRDGLFTSKCCGRGMFTFMSRRVVIPWVILLVFGISLAVNAEPLRPPAVPLIACDPYFSIWSQADKLTDADLQRPQTTSALTAQKVCIFSVVKAVKMRG